MTVRTILSLISKLMLGLMLMPVGHGGALATEYPTKPVRLIIPFSAGGSIDLVARLLAQAVRDRWHQSMIIENRAGGDGDLGAAFVARSPLDRPDIKERLAQLGIDTIASSPDDLRSYLTQEIDKWAKVIKAAGIQAR